MATQGSFTIVLDEDNKVLLVRRKDFPIWDLPGGRVEEGESIGTCAIREAYEETGYQISTDKKIGEYHRPAFNDIQHIYLGRITGGEAIKDGDETSKVKFFYLNRLPFLMVPHRRGQIKDYTKGNIDIVKTLNDSKVMLKVIKKLKHMKYKSK